MKILRLLLAMMLFSGCATRKLSTERNGLAQNRAEKVVVEGCTAFIHAAENPARGKPWAWYAPTFIGKYPNAAIEPMFRKLLDSGVAIAGIDVGESYGSAEGTARYSAFYKEMVRRGYSRTPALIAQSRGGLMLYNWAVENPKRVACIIGIYPVIDNRSYPGGAVAERLPDRNPILRLGTLRIPAFHIHGDSDKLVPLEANSGAMKKVYPGLKLKIIPGHGHEEIPEYFQDPELVRFILRELRLPVK